MKLAFSLAPMKMPTHVTSIKPHIPVIFVDSLSTLAAPLILFHTCKDDMDHKERTKREDNFFLGKHETQDADYCKTTKTKTPEQYMVMLSLTILLVVAVKHDSCSEVETFLQYKRCGFQLVCGRDQPLSPPC